MALEPNSYKYRIAKNIFSEKFSEQLFLRFDEKDLQILTKAYLKYLCQHIKQFDLLTSLHNFFFLIGTYRRAYKQQVEQTTKSSELQ